MHTLKASCILHARPIHEAMTLLSKDPWGSEIEQNYRYNEFSQRGQEVDSDILVT